MQYVKLHVHLIICVASVVGVDRVLRSRNFISGNRSADLQRTFIYFTSSYFCELTKCLNFDFEDTLFSRMKTKQTYHYKYTVVPFFRLLFSQIWVGLLFAKLNCSWNKQFSSNGRPLKFEVWANNSFGKCIMRKR